MRYGWLLALVVLASGLAPADAAAAPKTGAIQLQVRPHATLLEDGSVRVSVRIRCAPFGETLESNITVTQDDGAIFAQTGIGDATCDRRWHTNTAVATPLEGSFHRGPAFASAFVLLLDPETGETLQGQDSRTIRVH